MAKVARLVILALMVGVGAAVVRAARRVVDAPPDEEVAAWAEAAGHAGPWWQGYARVNGLRMHYAEAGSGPLVVLLHGFPETWYMWRNVIPVLSTRFHVVAPDMRGYNESDKPEGVGSYTLDKLSEDIVGLIKEMGEERAHIVGHDWGGVIAWHMGQHYPEVVEKLVVINAPHPATFQRELRRLHQLARSWYAFFFQLPLLPEAAVRATIRGLAGSAAVPGAFTEEALDVYENGVSQPGAATAMINYYRAAARQSFRIVGSYKVVDVPTLVIWGMKDTFLSPRLLDGLERWVRDVRIERVEESAHWVPEEKPERVTELLVEFLAS